MNNPYTDVLCPHCGEYVDVIYGNECANCGENVYESKTDEDEY